MIGYGVRAAERLQVMGNDVTANYQRYGCARNPFHYPDLDPLIRPEDEDLFVTVDGFQAVCSAAGPVRTILSAAVEKREPAFFLVSGGGWSGKKAASRHILNRYRELRGITRDRFVVPDPFIPHFAVVEAVQQWLMFLDTELEPLRDLYAEPDREFFRDVERLTPPTIRPRTQAGLRGLANRLAGATAPAGFGVHFYGKLTSELVETAFSMLAKAQTVCVFQTPAFQSPDSHAAEVERWFSEAKGNARTGVIRLEPLDAQEVGDLARVRWERVAAGLRPPFSLQDLVAALKAKRRSIGGALRVLHDLIEKKLDEHPAGANWPDASDLEFTGPELAADIPFLERYHERP